jgi:hypothetical protein
MEATEYKVDKSTWGPGEWQAEPDREDWIAHGFACFALRHEQHGHWCGYVGVPREHALYGKTYDQIRTLQVHGGVSYTARCAGDICHAPVEGMPEDVWWIGFACGNTWDKSPGRDARLREAAAGCRERGMEDTAALFEHTLQPMRPEVYRNLYYVHREVLNLAAQLAGAGNARRGKKARA